jgi:hypothetical protein
VASFSIYVHSAPGFVFDESTTRSLIFRGRELKNSIQVSDNAVREFVDLLV